MPKLKGDPGLPPLWDSLDNRKHAGLCNSHDPLHGHVLKHNQRLASLLA